MGSPRQEKQKHSTEVLQYRARVSESWLFFSIFFHILPSEDEITRGPGLGKSYCIMFPGLGKVSSWFFVEVLVPIRSCT